MAKEGQSTETIRTAPVEEIPPDARAGGPEDGIALCLSGGGYRAMLFHVGALWRLNQIGYLSKLARISSVSGGAITAGVLGMHWTALGLDRAKAASPAAFRKLLVDPIRRLAGTTIDRWSIISGGLGPDSISDKVTGAYRKHLFGRTTLQDLPDEPRFVFNATNVQTRSLFRFSKPHLADWRLGMVTRPTVELAVAVAASSAFPPFLSPAYLDLGDAQFTHGRFRPKGADDLQRPPFTTDLVLTDGGVYDNLGLETAWKSYTTILVSDGGGQVGPDETPEGDWARHTYRVLNLIDHQVRSLRKRLADRLVQGAVARPEAPGRHLLGDPQRRGGLPPECRARVSLHPAAVPARDDLADRGDEDPSEVDGRQPPGAPDQLGLCDLRRRDAQACGRPPACAGRIPIPRGGARMTAVTWTGLRGVCTRGAHDRVRERVEGGSRTWSSRAVATWRTSVSIVAIVCAPLNGAVGANGGPAVPKHDAGHYSRLALPTLDRWARSHRILVDPLSAEAMASILVLFEFNFCYPGDDSATEDASEALLADQKRWRRAAPRILG